MKERERTAYHEAGHHVACIALRRRIRSVTIVPDEDTLGRSLQGSLGRFQPDTDWDKQTQAKLEREIIILLAGAEAVKRAAGGLGRLSDYQSDFGQAADLALSAVGDDQANEYLERLSERTKKLLREWWPSVVALASALLREETIGPNKARMIVREGRQ